MGHCRIERIRALPTTLTNKTMRPMKSLAALLTASLLAATALQHDLTLVTRNTKDFAGLAVRLINPWEA